MFASAVIGSSRLASVSDGSISKPLNPPRTNRKVFRPEYRSVLVEAPPLVPSSVGRPCKFLAQRQAPPVGARKTDPSSTAQRRAGRDRDPRIHPAHKDRVAQRVAIRLGREVEVRHALHGDVPHHQRAVAVRGIQAALQRDRDARDALPGSPTTVSPGRNVPDVLLMTRGTLHSPRSYCFARRCRPS